MGEGGDSGGGAEEDDSLRNPVSSFSWLTAGIMSFPSAEEESMMGSIGSGC